jgi:hypothetical protein
MGFRDPGMDELSVRRPAYCCAAVPKKNVIFFSLKIPSVERTGNQMGRYAGA